MISAKPLQDLIGIPHRLRALLELLGLVKQLWSHVLMGACPAPLSIKPVKGHCSLLAGAFTTTRILQSAAGTRPTLTAHPPKARNPHPRAASGEIFVSTPSKRPGGFVSPSPSGRRSSTTSQHRRLPHSLEPSKRKRDGIRTY